MKINQRVQVRPVSEVDREFCYQVKKRALGLYIEQTWGWNESFQREFHSNDWAGSKPEVIMLDRQDIGTIEIKKEPELYSLREFYLLPEFQRKGIGTYLLSCLTTEADLCGMPIHLDVLKVNPAKKLYERTGFETIEETSTHYKMRRMPNQAASGDTLL